MPAIIQSNQKYLLGETPVFIAYIYDDTAITPQEVTSIKVSHLENRTGIKNGVIVKDWYPVEYGEGSLENILISNDNFFPTVSQTNNDAFTYTTGNRFDYNFLYIPYNGKYYYQKDGDYKTIFHIEYINGKSDVITFESSTRTDIKPIHSVEYGKDIHFAADIYTKVKQDDGKFMFPTNDNDYIKEVFMTIYDQYTSKIYIDRISIGNVVLQQKNTDTTIFNNSGVTPFLYNFYYKYPSDKLPSTGIYRFKFEFVEKDLPDDDADICFTEVLINII